MSSHQNIFSELGSGARFDYLKYGSQIRKLSSKSARSTVNGGAASGGRRVATQLPGSLDFFGSLESAHGDSKKERRTTGAAISKKSNHKKTKDRGNRDVGSAINNYPKSLPSGQNKKKGIASTGQSRKKRPRPLSSKSNLLSSVTSSDSESTSSSSGSTSSDSASASSSSSSDSDSDSDSDSSGDEVGTDLFKKKSKQTHKMGSAVEDDEASKSASAIARGRALLQEAEEVRAFRRKLKIFVEGNDIADPLENFDSISELLPVQDAHVVDMLLKNIEASRYTEPTPVQMQAIPSMIEERDVLAVAPTGSGKTAAFLIPVLARLKTPKKSKKNNHSSNRGPRAIVVTPTRELAVQILREFQRLSKGKRFRAMVLSKANAGGSRRSSASHSKKGNTLDGKDDQQGRALAATDLIVTTPMRLVHLIRRGGINVSGVQCVVLDEADRLFEEGFLDQIDTILGECGKENDADENEKLTDDSKHKQYSSVQRAMFSATMPQGIEEMIQTVLRDPVRVRIGSGTAAAKGADTIDQRLLFVGREEGKLLAVRQLVQSGIKPPIIMFVQSIARAQALFQELCYDGINVDVIHADRSQAQRDGIIRRFRTGEIWILIATDLMARGMDFKGVNCVINYDFPQSVISYVHRIGRTGRAGRPGEAITFFTESDMTMLRSIANVMKLSGCDVPDWMLTMKKMRHSDKKRIKSIPVKRRPISTTAIYDKQRARKLKQAKEASRRAKASGNVWLSKTERKKRRRMGYTSKGGKDNDDNDDGGWTVVQ